MKWALMVENCFGRDWLGSGIPVTRVEFRVRRDILKCMGIDSMQDLLESESGLARYCCYSWFRLLDEPKKAGHTHEQDVCDFWLEVQEAFGRWFPGVEGHRREVHRSYDKNLSSVEPDTLLLQGGGCFASYAARTAGRMGSVSDVLEFIVTNLSKIGERIYTRSVALFHELSVRSGFALWNESSVDPQQSLCPDVLKGVLEKFGVSPNLCNAK